LFIDASLYPDMDVPPTRLDDDGAKADYPHRVCAAMDFRVFPEPDAPATLAGWKDIFDRYPLAASPAYRALRGWFGWEPVEVPRNLPATRPAYMAMDALSERGPDPCEGMI
jgi:hypothetical protein